MTRRMMDFKSGLYILLTLVGLAPAYATELVTLDSRPDVTQQFVLHTHEKPVASVIFFPGYNGWLKLTDTGKIRSKVLRHNFLVRHRDWFIEQGFNVAIFDAPSEHQRRGGMFGGFRATEEHAQDIAAVVAYLKQLADVPVWLVGISRGTESASNGLIRVPQGIRGMVLAAPVSVENSKGVEVPAMALDKIRVPALIVIHENDGCWVTPPEGADEIKKGLVNSPLVEVKYFSGGLEPEDQPCRSRSEHGFYGIEDEVIKSMAAFIQIHSQ